MQYKQILEQCVAQSFAFILSKGKGCHQLHQYFLNIYIFYFKHTWFEWNDAPKTHLAFGEAISDCWQKEIRGHWLAIKNWKCCQASFFLFQFNFFLSSPKQMIWRRVISSTMSLFDWIWWSLRGHFQEDPCNDFWRVLVQFTWTATCLRPVTDLFFANKYFWWTSKKQSSFFYPHWRMIWWNGLIFNCTFIHNSHFYRT